MSGLLLALRAWLLQIELDETAIAKLQDRRIGARALVQKVRFDGLLAAICLTFERTDKVKAVVECVGLALQVAEIESHRESLLSARAADLTRTTDIVRVLLPPTLVDAD